MPPSWSSAFAGGSSSGHTPSSSARASSGRCDWRIRSLRWWSKVGYRKKRSCSISKCLFSSRIPPFRRVRSCSPSASARTVTAHSLKATGIGRGEPPSRARRVVTRWRGPRKLRDRNQNFKGNFVADATSRAKSCSFPRIFRSTDHRGEVLVAVAGLGGGGVELFRRRRQGQVDAQRLGLAQAVAHVLQH